MWISTSTRKDRCTPKDSPGARYPMRPICRSLRSLEYFLEKANPPVRETVEVIFATIAVSRAAERAKKAEEEKDKGFGRSNKDW